MMKEINLKQGYVTFVDDEDYECLNQWKWYLAKSKHTSYVVRCSKGSKRKTIFMHRLLLNAPVGMEVDHIDHNGLNNQRHNIRICTRSQNHMNSRSFSKSKYKGVYYDKGYVIAQIKGINKKIYLGLFKTEEEAARAYDIKAKEIYGEFANLNIK